jgi:hypothetical protein
MSAIISSEIVFRLTTTAGAAGDSTAQANPNASLGKYASTTAWAGGVANDLFDDISGAENAASTVDYRAIAVLNNNAANTFQNPVVYISAETAGGASIALATDNIAASAKGSASAQLAQIASETTAPTGVSAFSSPTTVGAGLALGDIPVANVKGFWVKRTAANSSALSSDGVTITVSGDTGSL